MQKRRSKEICQLIKIDLNELALKGEWVELLKLEP